MARTRRIAPIGLQCAVTLLASSVAAECGATGFFINQQSAAGIGRVDAGNVAAANDPGTLFFNPAGMSRLWDSNESANLFDVGLLVIVPRSNLDNAGSTAATPGTLGAALPFAGANAKDPTDPTPVLNLYYARRLGDGRLALGLRFNSPFGLAADYDPGWFGRYDSIKADLRTANVGFTLSYRLTDRLAIGGGIDAQYADSKLATAIPNPFVPGGPTAATDGRFDAEGHDWQEGFNVGVLWQATHTVRIGAHYRSAIEQDLSGSATTSGLTGPLAPFNGTTSASTKLDLPAIASVGLATEPMGSKVTIYADYTWYGWGKLSTIRIDLGNAPAVVREPNFRDTYSVAAGVDYRLRERFTLRGGLKYDRTPTSDGYRDTTFADDNRLWFSIGGTYRRDSFTMDFAFVHVLVDDTSVDVVRTFFDGTPLASSVRTRANVSSNVTTLALGFRWAF